MKLKVTLALNDADERRAEFSGICPLCSKYIVKKRSWVKPLRTPLVPRGDGYRSEDDGGIYNANGRPISMRPRRWAHAKCADNYLRAQGG